MNYNTPQQALKSHGDILANELVDSFKTCLSGISVSISDISCAVGTMYASKLMKSLILSLLMVLMGIGSVKSAIITSTAAGGNWSNVTTWVDGVVPGAGDDVIINSGTVTMDVIGSCTNFTLNSGTFNLNHGTSFTLTIAGNYSQNGGAFDFNNGYSGTSTLNLDGNITQTDGSMTTTKGSMGKIVFIGTGTQTINFTNPQGVNYLNYLVNINSNLKLLSNIGLENGSLSVNEGDITVNGSIDLGTFTITGLNSQGLSTFTLSAGATLITANTGGLDGSILSSITSRHFNARANYTFNGNAAQVTGNGLTGANNLIINNSGSTGNNNVSLSGNVSVSGTLTLISGILTSTANSLLAITNISGSAVTGYSLSSYVNGPLKWYLTNSGSYFFPVGDAINYRPFELNSVLGSSMVVTVTMLSTGASTVDGTSLSAVASRNWYVQVGGTITKATVRITESGLGTSNAVASSSVQAGPYSSKGGNNPGLNISSNTGISVNTSYFAIGTIAPSVVLSNDGTQVVASSTLVGTTNLVLHKSALAVTLADATLNGIICTTAGNYVSADVINLKAWYQTTGPFDAGSAILLSTLTTPDVSGAKTFPPFIPQVIGSGSTGYIFITADISPGATVGKTINLNAMPYGNFNFTAATKSGSTTVGGLQTFASTTYYNKLSGANALHLLSNWGTNANGTGTAPANFTTNYQVFNITNGTSATIGSGWSVSGTNSKVVLGNTSFAAITFTVPSTSAFTGTIDITTALSGSNTIILQNSTIPTFGILNTGSTVDYNGTSQTVTSGIYSNLKISATESITIAGGNIAATALNTSLGSTLNMQTFALDINSITNNGTIATQNITTTPVPSGETWSGTGEVLYNGTSAQTAVAGTFNNLSIDNPTGVSLASGATIAVNALLINSGKLEIGTGTSVNVINSITNNVGVSGLVIKAGNGVPNGTLTFRGPSPLATVEMYSQASWNLSNLSGSRYQWQYFGIPVEPVAASPTFDGAYVRMWNEAEPDVSKHWVQQTNASVLNPFTGYEISQPSATTYQIQGQLVNADFMTYSTSVLPFDANAAYPGQCIFANPYTAAIDINKLTFGTGTEATVYLYNTGTLNDWQTHTGDLIHGSLPGQYTAVPKNLAGEISNPTIPSMQGFLVKAMADNNGNASANAFFSITYSSVATPNTSPLRAPVEEKTLSSEYVSTRIDVAGTNYSDRMWIFTHPACSHQFNNGWDGAKMLGSPLTPQLFALEKDGNYQVDAVDDMNNTELGFQAGEDVNYTLTFTHTNIQSRYAGVYLMDKVENKTTDMTESGSTYSFLAESSAQAVNRFTIITRPYEQTVTDNDSQLKIFSAKGTVLVQNFSNQKGEVMIYDVAGHYLKTATLAPDGGITVLTGFIPGVFVAKAVTSQEKVTKRLIVE